MGELAVLAGLLGLGSGIMNFLGTSNTNRTNSQNVSRTNLANLQQTMLANESNEKIANEVNALNYKMFGEGNAFSAEEAEKARRFNAVEAEKTRNYNSAVAQVARSLAAGVSPSEYDAATASPATSSAQGSPLSGMSAITGAPAQAASLQAAQAQAPYLDLGGVENSLLGFSNLLETKRKNDADIARDMRNAKSSEVQADASKVQAQASKQNANTSEKMLGVAQQNADTQSAVGEAQANLITQQAEFQRLTNEAFPQRLQNELKVSGAQANQLTQLAASYNAQLGFLYTQLKMNDTLQRDLQDGKLNAEDRHFAQQIGFQYQALSQKIDNDLNQLKLSYHQLNQARQMFDKEFEATHGGYWNEFLDQSGLPRMFGGSFVIPFSPVKLK